MIRRNPENCQHEVNDKEAEVSVDIFSDLVDFIVSVDPAMNLSHVPAILAEVDAVQAEFAVTADTPDDVKIAALSGDQLAELDAVLADFDMQGKRAAIYEEQVSTPIATLDRGTPAQSPVKAAIEAWQAKRAPDKEANRRFGHTAQAMDAIDAHRKTEQGRAANAKMQRDEYAETIRATEGREVRAYVHRETDEDKTTARRAQKAASKANRSPAQVDLERKADAARKAASRKAAKTAAQKAIDDKAIFG